MNKEYLDDPLDAAEVAEMLRERHPAFANSPIVEFTQGRRTWRMAFQNDEMRGDFDGKVAKTREFLRERRAQKDKP